MEGVSIVVETENLGGEVDELEPLLVELGRQIQDSGIGAEALVVTDDVGSARRALAGSNLEAIVPVRVLDSGDRGYYGMKDLGATEAGGEVIVFVDSDVRPEPGWLRTLVAPFDDPSVMLVGGTTSLGPLEDLFSRAMSLSGNFPVRTADGAPRPHDRFWANNFAARRSLLHEHPFGEDGRRRGQCWSLGRRLLTEGVTLWSAPGARVVHETPPRRGLLGFAFQTGRDMLVTERSDGRSPARGWVRLSGYFAKQTLRVVTPARRAVGLPVAQLPAALALGLAYNAAAWLGATTALLRAA